MKRILLLILSFPLFIFSQHSSQEENYYNDSLMFSFLESEQYSKAEEVAFKIIEEKNNDSTTIFIINAYTVLGIINKNRGFYLSALENYLSALNASKLILDSARVSAALNNIGIIHNLQENHITAIDYFKQSLEIELKKNNTIQRSIRYYNIADSYFDIDSLELAINYYSNSLLLENKANNREGIHYAKLGLAQVYQSLNDSYQVEKILNELKNEYDSFNTEVKVLFLTQKALFQQFQENHLEALSILDNALSIADTINFISKRKDILFYQIKSYTALSDFESAVKRYEDYYAINQKLLNTEVIQKTGDLNYKNELSRKKLEIELLQEQKELLDKNLDFKSKIANYELRIIIFALALIIILCVFIAYIIKLSNKE